MKEPYNSAEMELVKFVTEDVIATSLNYENAYDEGGAIHSAPTPTHTSPTHTSPTPPFGTDSNGNELASMW